MKTFTTFAFFVVVCVMHEAHASGEVDEDSISDKSDELSSDMLDCIEEFHPLYKKYMDLEAKCEKEFPSLPTNSEDRDDYDETLDANHADRRNCINEFNTPENTAKSKDIQDRCGKLFIHLSDSQSEKVEKLMKQDEWSRVL